MKVELGFLLEKDYKYYENIIRNNNKVIYENIIETWDYYYTNKNLDGLTENQMKESCIRQRNVKFLNEDEIKHSLQNMKIINKENSWYLNDELEKELLEINKLGFYKFDPLSTHKIDYQLRLENMKSALQFQLIDHIGLVLYYDNPDYYDLEEKEQRKKLIDELNSYGFDFKYTDLGVDKLRTLYYGRLKFSLNQNS